MHHNKYLIGLGCNLDPEQNMARMVHALLPYVNTLVLSRVLATPPVGMNSYRQFLNCVAYIETTLSADEFKTLSNEIEATMGRDRADPDSKRKDRPADIDILCQADRQEIIQKPVSAITEEYFLYPVISELQAFLDNKPLPVMPAGVSIQDQHLFFGQTPTTIDRDTDTSQKRVLQ
ncbi:2-amino-4-hydroxy-6-hydroxymethyldihydropteridine diphosphokinase [Methylophaga frappieri]|uniref:2-amino-4-hydroxy-6- hydroxymethyldihydropteridine diphosphokinase n=1 Tax=Methylophaga frappieri (strain ATCC BAA-2434 / DSM 25690 / JAM7) TaxID=754477 RepID=UPI00067FF7D2|nr:2-amino-4-hydroxy-6-hydroxymethyldihydropteridine diphosphokinase [Methylophaga frappieri]